MNTFTLITLLIIAFLFCIILRENLIKNNMTHRLKQLWIIALFVQIPYTLILDTYTLNPLFSLIMSLFFYKTFDKDSFYEIHMFLFAGLIFKIEAILPIFLIALLISVFMKKEIFINNANKTVYIGTIIILALLFNGLWGSIVSIILCIIIYKILRSRKVE